MRYRIKLKLETPLITAGKKLGNNYIKSKDYVAGSVFRAALAREILNRCSYYDGTGEKIYWVEFKNKEECKQCKFKNICKDFSNIKLDTLYPLGGKPYPNTNMRCKYNSKHKDVDTLIYKINRHIGIDIIYNGLCSCGERLEKHSGLGKNGKDIESIYKLITKNRISPYMRRSKEGILYSLDTLSEKIFLGDEEVYTEFEGTIESGLDILNDLANIKILRVGAYTTSGFGKCSLFALAEKDKGTIKTLEERIKRFNLYIEDDKNYYLSFDLLSNAYLGLEKIFEHNKAPSSIETQEFISKYEEILNKYLGKEFKLEIPIVNNEWRRGFDTSKKVSIYRKEKLVSKAGSLFVFSIPKEKIDYEKLLQIQKEGIGNNTEHGFGKIAICSEEHIKNRMKTEKEV